MISKSQSILFTLIAYMSVLVLIGIARLVLTLAYVLTKNIWVSAGAHILNDWAIFGVTVFADADAA